MYYYIKCGKVKDNKFLCFQQPNIKTKLINLLGNVFVANIFFLKLWISEGKYSNKIFIYFMLYKREKLTFSIHINKKLCNGVKITYIGR